MESIVTGGFQSGTAAPTLVLLNKSEKLDDLDLAAVASILTGKILGVELATRLAGPETAVAAPGEWAADITDAMVAGGPVNGAAIMTGALLGSAIRREIERGMM